MADHHLLVVRPNEIPLIITSTSSSPDFTATSTNNQQQNQDGNTTIRNNTNMSSTATESTTKQKPFNVRKITRRKWSDINNQQSSPPPQQQQQLPWSGGSFKYEIGTRNRSLSNLIGLPKTAKWSSVRIKGTGFTESRKSIVKIECNSNGNIPKDYQNLIVDNNSPTTTTTQTNNNNTVKKNIGNVSVSSEKK